MTEHLRIVVYDHSGHPFQFQLSKELTRRGHTVLHLYSAQFQTPKSIPADEPGYTVEGLVIPGEMVKYSYVRRYFQDSAFGALVAGRLRDFAPDVVISCNAPLDVQKKIIRQCKTRQIPMIYWLQDIYSTAITQTIGPKYFGLGALIAKSYRNLERSILRNSTAIVTIADHFRDICAGWGIARERCRVIENWAPLDEIVPLPRDNAWAREHGLAGKRVVLYSGTLGLKHDPEIIARLARHFDGQDDVRIVVISEGLGADWLKTQHLQNLVLLPFQPYDRFSEVLATGDVVFAILNQAAGGFSVPSKVLSYLSAAKPIVLSVPSENLAAETLRRADAGIVVAPDDFDGLAAAMQAMLSAPDRRALFSRNARRYAETAFDIRKIGDQFEGIAAKAAASRTTRSGAWLDFSDEALKA